MRGGVLRRISLRWQITLPFIILALVFGFGAILMVNRLLSDSSQERFWRQVADAGQQAADAVVRIEQDLLEVERLIANTEGLSEAVLDEDSEALRDRVLPLILNADLDSAAVLNQEGSSLLAVRQRPDEPRGSYERAVMGEDFYVEWELVQQVLDGDQDSIGDKYSGIESIYLGSRELPTLYLAGPVRGENDEVIGVVLAGQYLDSLIEKVRVEAGANVSIYAAADGRLMASTLEHENPAAVRLEEEQLSKVLQSVESSEARILDAAGSAYGEILLPLVVREGAQVLGVLGVSILAAPIEAEIADSMRMVVGLGVLALIFVVTVGLLVAQLVVRSLNRLNEQVDQLTDGTGETPLPETGSAEVSRLARSLNRLTMGVNGASGQWKSRTFTGSGLHSIQNEAAEGEAVISTISTLAILVKRLPDRLTQPDPQETLSNLATLLRGIRPIALDHGGVMDQFRSDELIIHFGVTPQLRRPQVNSLQATHAAMEIHEYINQWNASRADRGLPAVEVGMAVATGRVITGSLDPDPAGESAVIGDVIQIAQQVARATQAVHGSSLLISEETYRYLASAQHHFEFGRYGKTPLQGRQDEVVVYEVRDRSIRLRE